LITVSELNVSQKESTREKVKEYTEKLNELKKQFKNKNELNVSQKESPREKMVKEYTEVLDKLKEQFKTKDEGDGDNR